MLKRISALLLTLILIPGLFAGCSSADVPSDVSVSSEPSSSEVVNAAASEAVTTQRGQLG